MFQILPSKKNEKKRILTEEEFKKLKKLAKYLKEDEVELLKEIARKKREANAIWGI